VCPKALTHHIKSPNIHGFYVFMVSPEEGATVKKNALDGCIDYLIQCFHEDPVSLSRRHFYVPVDGKKVLGIVEWTSDKIRKGRKMEIGISQRLRYPAWNAKCNTPMDLSGKQYELKIDIVDLKYSHTLRFCGEIFDMCLDVLMLEDRARCLQTFKFDGRHLLAGGDWRDGDSAPGLSLPRRASAPCSSRRGSRRNDLCGDGDDDGGGGGGGEGDSGGGGGEGDSGGGGGGEGDSGGGGGGGDRTGGRPGENSYDDTLGFHMEGPQILSKHLETQECQVPAPPTMAYPNAMDLSTLSQEARQLNSSFLQFLEFQKTM